MTMFKKIIQLLSRVQKKQAIVLSILALIGMLLEMMGVGLIFPILSLMTEPNITNKYPLTQPIFEFFNNPTQVQLVIGAMLALAVFYFFKVMFLAYLSWKKVSFVADLRVYLSQKLFLGYLNQPYTFHLQRNSSQLVRNVTGDVKSINKGIVSIMDLMIDGLVLFGVFSLLLWVEPIGALSVTLFFVGTATLLHSVTRGRLIRWGEEGRFHLGKSLQHLYQGLGGIKELKLLGREKGFESQYFKHSVGMAKVEKKQKVFSTLPRLWFEFLVIVGLTGLVVVMLYQGKTPSELVPILGVFAAAAFRLMPSMVRIISALQNLRFNDAAVKNVHSEFSILNKNKNTTDSHKEKKSLDDIKESIELWQKIQIKELSFSYPSVKQYVLDDINIDICRNESVGFVGGSGAGKSTLIDIILGLFPPSEGEIQIGGVDISQCLRGWQNQIGYVPQTIYLTDDTIRRNIAFGLADDEINDNAVFAAVKSAQLEALIDDLAEGVDTLVGEHGVRLSGGQRQRIGIARALYRDPSVLVLDEATSALDINTEKDVMAAVNALHGKKTIITIAHRMTTVANCDRLYRLEEGKIIQEGTFEEVVSK